MVDLTGQAEDSHHWHKKVSRKRGHLQAYDTAISTCTHHGPRKPAPHKPAPHCVGPSTVPGPTNHLSNSQPRRNPTFPLPCILSCNPAGAILNWSTVSPCPTGQHLSRMDYSSSLLKEVQDSLIPYCHSPLNHISSFYSPKICQWRLRALK